MNNLEAIKHYLTLKKNFEDKGHLTQDRIKLTRFQNENKYLVENINQSLLDEIDKRDHVIKMLKVDLYLSFETLVSSLIEIPFWLSIKKDIKNKYILNCSFSAFQIFIRSLNEINISLSEGKNNINLKSYKNLDNLISDAIKILNKSLGNQNDIS